MKPSKYNIISKIHNSEDFFIVNPLTNNADILSADEARKLLATDVVSDEGFSEKGYIADPQEEERLFRRSYLDFIDERDKDEVQLFYVNNYSCNFLCSYCYQSGYSNEKTEYDPEVADRFFEYARANFSTRKYYVTLFGGEPLLPQNEGFLAHFLGLCRKYGIEAAIVTNGYFLKKYLSLLSENRIREIQVTLDGTEKIHDSRRHLKNGTRTFGKITEGIDAALAHGFSINLRTVIDRDNIEDLPSLARFAIQKGWTGNPLFKTQLGRNYELHYCQSGTGKLYSRIELYRDIYGMIADFPEILEFHRPAMSVSKYLFEQGKLPPPLFDACPGCKTEWAFDYTGKIYSCTANVGKEGEELGTFYPEVRINWDAVNEWQNRDILSVAGCRNCNLALACGGGCAAVAKNNRGNILSPDCRPVKELLELGISLYGNLNTVEK